MCAGRTVYDLQGNAMQATSAGIVPLAPVDAAPAGSGATGQRGPGLTPLSIRTQAERSLPQAAQ